MSFLYPMFLLAGLALAIPVLIHLFNLRRYKTVLFPHTRFLKNIETRSRKQREVRHKWLLITRLLLLAFLILAFAQPFFPNNQNSTDHNNFQIIYLDNSQSMSVVKGQQRLLDLAKHAALRQITSANAGTRFLLLTNDRLAYNHPVTAEKIRTQLNEVELSPLRRTPDQILSVVQSAIHAEQVSRVDLYYYSDFQKTSFESFESITDSSLLQQIRMVGIPVQSEAVDHLFIDTAWLTAPSVASGQDNQIIVRTKRVGKQPEGSRVLQLDINGQIKNVASLEFPNSMDERFDTLDFRIDNPGWQRIAITTNDHAVRFDDTFRIATRTLPGLSVLVLNESTPNPYIQAAFRASQGFRLTNANIQSPPKQWSDYNLIILNDIKSLDGVLANSLAEALEDGKTICIFPGRTENYAALNQGLQALANIEIVALDTAVQRVSEIQPASDLVKNIFERIPENVQLPVTNWHYVIHNKFDANRQSVMSFRNGAPFLARFTSGRGQLYLLATSADLFAGNFPNSYFFAPFLYQMAIQAGQEMIYAITAGQQQPVYIPIHQSDNRNIIHLHGDDWDVIPPQRTARSGLYVYTDRAAIKPGFYTLRGNGTDSVQIAINADRQESALEVWTMDELEKQWPQIQWVASAQIEKMQSGSADSRFPLWKVCITLALFMLLIETILLTSRISRQNVATQ